MENGISTEIRRAVLESQLERCRDNVMENYLEMGRLLNQAKDEHLYPAGGWADWVSDHACMGERAAQRCMQAAREIPAGSPLAALDKTKLRALLTLPEADREKVAADIDAVHITSREVENKIKAIRAGLEEEKAELSRALGTALEGKRDAELKVGKLRADLTSAENLDRARLCKIKDLKDKLGSAVAAKQSAEEELDEVRAEVSEEYAQKLEEEKKRHKDLRDEQAGQIHDLQTAMLTLKKERDEALKKAEDGGISPEEMEKIIAPYNKTIKKLNDQIDDLTDALDQAQTESARRAMSGEEKSSPVTRILSSIGGLMAQAGQAPGELSRLANPLDEEDKALLVSQARAVGTWAMRIIAVCGGELYE